MSAISNLEVIRKMKESFSDCERPIGEGMTSVSGVLSLEGEKFLQTLSREDVVEGRCKDERALLFMDLLSSNGRRYFMPALAEYALENYDCVTATWMENFRAWWEDCLIKKNGPSNRYVRLSENQKNAIDAYFECFGFIDGASDLDRWWTDLNRWANELRGKIKNRGSHQDFDK